MSLKDTYIDQLHLTLKNTNINANVSSNYLPFLKQHT